MKGRKQPKRPSSRPATPVSKIPGVQIVSLARYDDPRGWLTELFREDELPRRDRPVMAYVSATKPGQSRGPHEHRRQTDIFCFIGPGDFQIYLWDNRKRSATFEQHERFVLGAKCPCRLTIPPGVVHGYKNISKTEAVCFNAPNRLYRGRGRKTAVDEIRHEADAASPFHID
ncbi:MAG TPA: dTDP-4-dehydrorhamnose 3,5-epimerase family protein [Planctomycetota bacterium]|nr:dTDP-4-dehydrorhamnose 3,5-epimerase family protein [Planctomycetota bacterium]